MIYHKFSLAKGHIPANSSRLTPSQIVHHDHCYCLPHYQPSSYLTSISTIDMVCLHTMTNASTITSTDISTITDPYLHSATSFQIEIFVENYEAIIGFENYQVLMACFKFLGDEINPFTICRKYIKVHHSYRSTLTA